MGHPITGGDDTLPLTPYRLAQLESRLEKVDLALEAGFRELRLEIRALNFLPIGEYNADKRTTEERFKAVESKANASQRIAMICLGTVTSGALALIGVAVAAVT